MVSAQGDGSYAVGVRTPEGTTRHVVMVEPKFAAEVGWAHRPVEDLVAASFEFLLEREPATSILRRFDLDQITTYFPEYPDEIRGRLPI